MVKSQAWRFVPASNVSCLPIALSTVSCTRSSAWWMSRVSEIAKARSDFRLLMSSSTKAWSTGSVWARMTCATRSSSRARLRGIFSASGLP